MNRKCIHLIVSKDKMVAFCIAFKEWMKPSDSCPKRCNRVVEGVCGDMEEIAQRKYELECKSLTRRVTKEHNLVYHYSSFDQDGPYCGRCLFPSYIVDPKRNRVSLVE